MNTTKVFIWYNEKGKERLIYRKSDDIYIDLESKEKYSVEQVNDYELISYQNLYKAKEKEFIFTILNKYHFDRKKHYELKKLFYGEIVIVTKITKEIVGIDFYDAEFLFKTIKKPALVFFDSKKEFVDLESNQEFFYKSFDSMIEPGNLILKTKGRKPFYDFINPEDCEQFITKKKILELNRKIKKEKFNI